MTRIPLNNIFFEMLQQIAFINHDALYIRYSNISPQNNNISISFTTWLQTKRNIKINCGMSVSERLCIRDSHSFQSFIYQECNKCLGEFGVFRVITLAPLTGLTDNSWNIHSHWFLIVLPRAQYVEYFSTRSFRKTVIV